MNDRARLLRAYDDQLRTDAETPGAITVQRLGPLRLVTFGGGRGFITYRDLAGAEADEIAGLVEDALAYFVADAGIRRVEWKTRGHDRAPGLRDALVARAFVPEEPESIMIGMASALAVDVPLPDGITLRRVVEERDVRAANAMQDEVFGGQPSEAFVEAVLRRIADGDGIEFWVAETADGEIVSTGRLDPVADTDFAGIWGGATREAWRGRGIYRALTAARARSAMALGKTLVHSDSTEYSRPILERSGFVKVSTTTPYLWSR
ncbi:GNAT family N-acetyltransferase [Agromyces salentinus]|uniref:GNAT family N-acetyltransferase n=1 Tax=Agromyces salentinus TaxID=269421 RepID=A0ABN2MQZ5_9MICO|nr:GNAT family N-acetyltransferase [Agromyces salentinus]